MKKILFVGNLGKGSTFIDNDYKELQKHFEVKAYNPSLSTIEVFKLVRWCDVILSWFANWRAIRPVVAAKILKKKVIVIAGGYDCVYAPEINYGAWTRSIDKKISQFLFASADIVLPVSNYLKEELLAKITPKETEVVYNGVNVNKFYPQGKKINNLVVTTCGIYENNLKRKGLADFVRTARYLPDVRFVVMGAFKDDSIDYLRSIATENVEFLGYVDDKTLLHWYQKAKVYAQLSYHEGFGVAIVESMLCECIPVISTKGALPEVAGVNSYQTMYGSPPLAAMAIEKALTRNKKFAATFRQRALDNFSMEKRIKQLKRILA